MKNQVNDPKGEKHDNRSVDLLQQTSLRDRSNPTFGRTELYLLLLLFVGGIAIDSWFSHHPPKLERSLNEQPAGLSIHNLPL